MNSEFNEEIKNTSETAESEEKYAFKNVIKKNPTKRTWSVISLVLAALSVFFALFVPILGFIFGLLAVGASILSRVNIGYFDKLSMVGLISAIFGVVFSIVGFFFISLLSQFITNILLG